MQEFANVEAVSAIGVLTNHMIKFKIEGIDGREDPVVNELRIIVSGIREAEVVDRSIKHVVMAEIEVLLVEFIQGRCSSD